VIVGEKGFCSLLFFSHLTELSSPWDVKQKPGLMSIPIEASNRRDTISVIPDIWDLVMYNRSCRSVITHQFTLVMGAVVLLCRHGKAPMVIHVNFYTAKVDNIYFPQVDSIVCTFLPVCIPFYAGCKNFNN
jgi:hypothetical protein